MALSFKTLPLSSCHRLFSEQAHPLNIDNFLKDSHTLLQMLSQITAIKAVCGPSLPEFESVDMRPLDFEKMHWEYLFSAHLFNELNTSLQESIEESFGSYSHQTLKVALIAESFFYQEASALQDQMCMALLKHHPSSQEEKLLLYRNIESIESLCINSFSKAALLRAKIALEQEGVTKRSHSGFMSDDGIQEFEDPDSLRRKNAE